MPKQLVPVGRIGGGRRVRLGTIHNAATTSNAVSSNDFIVQPGRSGTRPVPTPPNQGGWPASGPVIGRRQVQPLPENDDDWVTYEVMPGVRLQARRGIEVGIQEVGTADVPVVLMTPGRIVGNRARSGGVVTPEYDRAGILPLLFALVKPVTKAVEHATHQRQQNGAPPVYDVGDTLNVNGIECTVAGWDAVGAVLIDTDGKRVVV